MLQNSIRDLSEIEVGWLEQLAAHYYDFGRDIPGSNNKNGAGPSSASGGGGSKFDSSGGGKNGGNIAEGRLANIN